MKPGHFAKIAQLMLLNACTGHLSGGPQMNNGAVRGRGSKVESARRRLWRKTVACKVCHEPQRLPLSAFSNTAYVSRIYG